MLGDSEQEVSRLAEPTMADHVDPGWDDDDDVDRDVTPEHLSQAVVTDTDWTTETILSQLRRGNIQLNPRFQRRDAWDRVRKSKFIESLVLGLPIPQLVLAENKARRGAFIVLDGKQRLLALRQFAHGSSIGSPEDEQGFSRLDLRSLDVRDDLSGKSLVAIERDPSLVDDLNALLNQPIRTVVVRNWPDEAFLHLVFLRLNTGSVQLAPQELRQAIHPGPFTNFLDDYSSESQQVRRALRISRPDFRMRDIEITLRFFAFHYFFEKYRGNLKQFLDNATGTLNKVWQDEESDLRSLAKDMDSAIDATFSIFGKDGAFYRWEGTRYEHRFNRPIFDIMMHYFKLEEVRIAALANTKLVQDVFRMLCQSDPDFLRSIQSTTKTMWATTYRLHVWGKVLGKVLGLPLSVPEVVDTRLR